MTAPWVRGTEFPKDGTKQMFSDVIGWVKGLFGATADEVMDGATGALDRSGSGVEEALGTAQEIGRGLETGTESFLQDGGATDLAQDFQESAPAGVTESAQGFQEQTQALGEIAEDPWDAAVEGVQGQSLDGK